MIKIEEMDCFPLFSNQATTRFNVSTHIRTRLLFIVCCTSLFLIRPSSTQAQAVGNIPDLGIEISPRLLYDASSSSLFAHVLYARIASLDQVDPNGRGMGDIKTIFLAAGARSKDLQTPDFRWRAGLIAMDLIRTPISMGLSVIDYDQSGLPDTDVKWLNLRIGPSLFLGNERTHFALRAVGTGGITTLKLGTFSYTRLGFEEEVNTRKRSYEVGYQGEVRILLKNFISIIAHYQHRNLLGGLRPTFDRATGKLGFKFSSALSAQGIYFIEEAAVSPVSKVRHVYGGSLSFVF